MPTVWCGLGDMLARMGGTARVAVFSTDPPGITTFHAFDPESFTVSSIITDALFFIDTEGAVRPALATDWRRISPIVL